MITQKQKIILKILGNFWTDIWEDQDFIKGLIKINIDVLYKHLQAHINNIYEQTSVHFTQLSDTAIPSNIIIDIDSKRNAVIALDDLVIANNTSTAVNQSIPNTYAYDILKSYKQSNNIYLKPLASQPIPDAYTSQSTLFISDIDIKSSGYLKTLNQKIYNCAQLWGKAPQYQSVLDIYTGICQVPDYWTYKYPRSVQHAWAIRLFGATPFQAKALIGCVCQCPVAESSGIVTAIKNKSVYIGDAEYKCWSDKAILVKVGDTVTKGDPLCAFSQNKTDIIRIYQGELPPSSIVPSIPVTTSKGVLYAQNRAKTRGSQNILPLTGSSDVLEAYIAFCRELQKDQYIPYTQIPQQVNPMQFLIQNVWKNCCSVFVIPERNTYDLQEAIKCILKNMPVGSIPIVYQYSTITQPLQLNLTVKTEILAYYNESVNNNLTLKVQ